MPISRTIKVGLAVVGVAVLAFAGRQGQRYYKKHLAAPRPGEAVYRQDCMSCHGPVGEGVAGKSDEPLVGEKSVASLAKYIAREMPENDPGTLSLADATASAEYIHQAFYSAEARARNHPPRPPRSTLILTLFPYTTLFRPARLAPRRLRDDRVGRTGRRLS